jgi:predicted transcriptional regulator
MDTIHHSGGRRKQHDAGIVVDLAERRYRDQMRTRWPSPDEYRTGARLAAANARRLSRAARRLERSEDFGPATALFATALEEAVKAGVLVLLEEESEAVAGDHEEILRLVFSKHETKYRLAAWAIGTSEQSTSAASASGAPGELLVVLGLLLVFIVLVDQVRRGEKLPEAAPTIDLATAPFLTHLASAFPEGSQTWAAKAFAERNRGLYVGFVGGHWEHPGRVMRQDADEARSAVVPIVQAASRWARAGKAVV